MQNSKTDVDYYTKVFILTCISWFFTWSVIPFFLYEGVYSDIIEWIANTQNDFSWGYDNHPYFGAWVIGSVDFWGDFRLAYLGCQTCLFVSVLSVWKLARYFLAPAESLIAVLFILLTPTYSFQNLVFSQGVILMAIWPLIILFFYRALLNQKNMDWLLLGLFCGLGLMTKYLCALLFVPMAWIMLFTKEGRASFRHAGFYLCSIVFLVIILPNIIWLFHNDFSTVDFAFHRTRLKETVPIIAHVTSPVKCVGLILANFIVAIALLFICFAKRSPVSIPAVPPFARKFVTIIGLAPFLMIIVLTLLTGAFIRNEWLHPTTILFGVMVVVYWRPYINENKIKKCLAYAICITFFTVLGTLFAVLYYYPYKHSAMQSIPLPTYSIANDITREWHKQFSENIKYVAGYFRFAAIMSVFSQDRPNALFMDFHYRNRYPDYKDDIDRYGAIIIWRGNTPPTWMENFKNEPLTTYQTRAYARAVKPWFAKFVKNVTGENPLTENISFAFIPPRDASTQY